MNTVNKNNNITKRKVQDLLEKEYEKIGISNENVNKILKSMKSRNISVAMRTIFYNECMKKVQGEKEEKISRYSRITSMERISIEVLYSAGFKVNFIAVYIGKHRSTIKREIDKNVIEYWDVNSTKSPYKNQGQENKRYYSASKAQKRANEEKLKNRKKHKLVLNPKLRKAVLGLLKEKGTSYSPDIIANLSKEKKLKDVVGSICANTIYNALKSKIEGFKISDFPHKRAYYKKETVEERRKKKEISERKKEISIEVMPEDIKEKLVDTHFEGDTIIGKKEGGGNTLITLAHTKSQFTFIMRSKNKTAQATVDVIDKLNSKVKDLDKIMKTLLLDNGTEFSDWDGIMRSMGNAEEKRMQVYFAHAYCSYERGCNENKNRLVRRTFKKGKAVETLSDEAIMNIARDMNNMPRKALGYKTPLEVFEEILVAKNVDTSFLEEYRIENSKYLVA